MSTPDGPAPSRRKAALANFTGSSATTMIAAAQMLFLTPVVLSQVSGPLYGAWAGSGDLLLWMLVFDFGLPSLMIQRIGAAHAQKDARTVGRYFATGMASLIGFSLLLVALVLASAPLLPGFLHIQGSDAETLSRCFTLAGVATAAIVLNYGFQGLSRAIQRTGTVNAFSVAGAIAGFSVAWLLLMRGMGLWSLAWGIVARSGVTLLGGFVFFFRDVDPAARRSLGFDREVAIDFARVCPSTFAAGISNALMNDSQAAIAGNVIGPEAALILAMTRRAADLINSILDIVNASTFGGFAHLWSENRAKAAAVFREIMSVFWSTAISLMAAYVAVDAGFVSVWVGPGLYGGFELAGSLALGLLIAGWSGLSMNLYRSSGALVGGSLAMVIECLCRIPLMVLLAKWIGLPGIPLGMAATGIVSGYWARSRIVRMLPQTSLKVPTIVLVCRAAVLVGACALGIWMFLPRWPFVIAGGIAVVVTSFALFLSVDPVLAHARSTLAQAISPRFRARPAGESLGGG